MTELYTIEKDGLFLIQRELNPPSWTVAHSGMHPVFTATKAKAARQLKNVRRIYRRTGIPFGNMKLYMFTEEDTFRMLRGRF